MFKKKSAANSIIKLMDENLDQNIELFKKDAKKASHEGSKGIAFTFTEIKRSTYEAAIYEIHMKNGKVASNHQKKFVISFQKQTEIYTMRLKNGLRVKAL